VGQRAPDHAGTDKGDLLASHGQYLLMDVVEISWRDR